MLSRALVMLLLAAGFPAAAQEKGFRVYGAQLEEFERRRGDDGEALLAWDGDAFFGDDNFKIRLISEGEYDLRENGFESVETRLLWQKPVSEFFDFKAGARLDYYDGGRDRWYAVLGAAGLAPQWFEIDADFFVGEGGRASARLDAEYELLLTNRLIAVFSAESTYAFAADHKAEIGTGVTGLEAGVRLGYDIIDRSVAPYIGAVYEKKYDNTAAMAREEGERDEVWFFVAGIRFKY